MPEPMGFFTDTTVCIGCKACEVACKEWNQLPAENGGIGQPSGAIPAKTLQLDGNHRAAAPLLGKLKRPVAGRMVVSPMRTQDFSPASTSQGVPPAPAL